jgi:phosphate uptake regulator
MPDQDTEYRKIQLTGGSTYVVSLPKDWIIENDLHKSDTVSVEELATGDLRISSIRNREIRRISVINTDDIKEGLLDLMIGAYIAGADVIRLESKKEIPRKTRMMVRGFLRDTRGMEIEDDKPHQIDIVSLLNPSELRLQVSINRMYLLITSLVEDSLQVINGEDPEILSDIIERERQIDARRLLLERQVATALQLPSVEKRLGIDRFNAMEHANIARAFERMGDHACRLAMLVNEHAINMKLRPDSMPWTAIPLWADELKKIVHNMYTRDINLIIDAKQKLAILSNDLESAESELWTGRGSAERLIAEFRVSESIRRICAYGVNIAEVLINMLMHQDLELKNKPNDRR